jgi:hypothetical protein
MNGRTIIHNPATPENVKRRQFILDSLRKSGLEWTEEIEADRIVIVYHGQTKSQRTPQNLRKPSLPPPPTLERCLKSRETCEPDELEYWDEMVRLTAGREGLTVGKVVMRASWKSDTTREVWAVMVSQHLAVNRCRDDWAVTHLGTGLAAGTASTLKDALRVARDVAHWPEWAILRDQADITPEFRLRATAAFKAVAA